MSKITACVIVKNEEKNIVTWLQSMKKIADEMIVVDTGSTDRTVEIAQTYGAKIFYYQWQDDFAAAKNFAIDQAQGDWILFLDADEYFSSTCIKKVPLQIARLDPLKGIDAVVCRIVNIDVDIKGRIINTFCNIRIFRNQPYLRYIGKVHEFLVSSQGAIRLFSLAKVLDVHHTGYSSQIIETKLKRNLAILKAEAEENGEREDQYRYFCDCYHGLREYEKVIEYARKHFDSGFFTVGGDQEIYKRMLDAMFALDKSEADIMQVLAEAKQAYPKEPTFWLYESFYYLKKNNYEGARRSLKKTLNLDKSTELGEYGTDIFILNRGDLYWCLAKVALYDQDRKAAIDYLWEGLQINKYQTNLAELFCQLLKEDDAVDSIALLNQMYQMENGEDLCFLLTALQKSRPEKIEAYYVNLALKRNLIEHPNRYRQLFALGEYEKAADFLNKSIKEQYFRLITACFRLQDVTCGQKAELFLPENYREILHFLLKQKCCTNNEQDSLYRELTAYAKALGVILPRFLIQN